jgi:outer membrane protein OmpA-like peptidoglycan-associated protein
MNRPLLLVLPALMFLSVPLAFSGPPAGASAPLPKKAKIILHGVSFDPNGGSVAPSAAPVLDEAARLLENNPDALVVIAPDTDGAADEWSNPRVAQRGVESVRDYLIRYGIAEPHVENPQLEPSASVASK